MEFKIDTKETFSTITPVADVISAKMATELAETCRNMRQSGSYNFIIDLQHCAKIENDAIGEIIAMHEESYGQEQSLVFTGMGEAILSALKADETDMLINIAPKMIEAIDIVSMEILERDLFAEE